MATYSHPKCSCISCRKEITINNIDKHIGSKACKINLGWKPDPDPLRTSCQYCNSSGFKRLISHEIQCKKNPNKSKAFDFYSKPEYRETQRINQLGRTPPEETCIKISNSIRKVFDRPGYRENFSKIMTKAVENNPESYSRGNVSGRCKIYEFNGEFYKGTWELVFAEWLFINKIPFERSKTYFPYFDTYSNKQRKYFPDFYLRDIDLYIEVKGYQRETDLLKWATVPNLIVIRDKEISQIKKNNFKPSWWFASDLN